MHQSYAASAASNLNAELTARLLLDSFAQNYRQYKVPDWPGLSTPALSPWVDSSQPMTRISYPWLRAFCLEAVRLLRTSGSSPYVSPGVLALSQDWTALVSRYTQFLTILPALHQSTWAAPLSLILKALSTLAPDPVYSESLALTPSLSLPADHDSVPIGNVVFTWTAGPAPCEYLFALFNITTNQSSVSLCPTATVTKNLPTPDHAFTWSVMRFGSLTKLPSYFTTPAFSFRTVGP